MNKETIQTEMINKLALRIAQLEVQNAELQSLYERSLKELEDKNKNEDN